MQHGLSITQQGQFPLTQAMRRALLAIPDLRCQSPSALADLAFLERFEMSAQASVAAVLRAHQIRRANPILAADLRAELANPGNRRRGPQA